jgi:hypothetical protein
MSAPSRPEVWLRGPLPGIDPVLMPAVHTLLQAREDIAAAAAGLHLRITTLKLARGLGVPLAPRSAKP